MALALQLKDSVEVPTQRSATWFSYSEMELTQLPYGAMRSYLILTGTLLSQARLELLGYRRSFSRFVPRAVACAAVRLLHSAAGPTSFGSAEGLGEACLERYRFIVTP
jgi:hypothetical protein